MKALIELSELITKNKIKRIEMIGSPIGKKKKSKVDRLYEQIQAGRVEDDEQAFHYLFEEESTSNRAIYRKIKSDLKKKLINTCLFINLKGNGLNDHQKAYYKCYRDWAALMILQGRGATINSMELAMKLLKTATKFEFTELGINISRRLIQEYCVQGKLREYKQYKSIYRRFVSVWQAELLAEDWYRDLSIYYALSISLNEEVHQDASKAIRELRPLLAEESSYRFMLMYGLIEVIRYLSINDYKKTIAVCQMMIQRIEKKDFLPKTGLLIFFHKLVICYTQLSQFADGEKAIQLSLTYSAVGTTNWFISMQLYFILAQRTRNYQKAYEIFNQVMAQSSFSKQRKSITEAWKIYEAFLHFLILIGKVQLPQNQQSVFRRFKLGKFINDVPIYSKDKRGMNIPILVIHLLFYLQRNKRAEAIDRIEAIEKYCSRYLGKDKGTYRSNCFVKMLLQIPKAGFRVTEVTGKVERYWEKLKATPIPLASQAYEIEVIPYEDLWGLTLAALPILAKPQKNRHTLIYNKS